MYYILKQYFLTLVHTRKTKKAVRTHKTNSHILFFQLKTNYGKIFQLIPREVTMRTNSTVL